MTAVIVDCPAKINLFLEILGKRADGYHEVATVMQTIELYDRLFFRSREKGIRIICRSDYVPVDERNLVFRTIELLSAEAGINRGVEVEIDKRIPVASGLGGASSDAAGTFIAINKMWNLGLTKEDMISLSEKIGTDIAFFIHLAADDFSGFSGGTFLGKGRGNEMQALPSLPVSWLVLIAPAVHVSTKSIYKDLNLELTVDKQDFKMIVDTLPTGDLSLISKFLFNRLESVTIPRYSVIETIKKTLLREGVVGALMSGSGPVVFGLVSDESGARAIAERISTRKGSEKVYVVKTY